MPRKPSEPEITNHLAELRERACLSAAALAAKVELSRQAIYAIEAGTYVPNTGISLRLAKALAVRVDELFELKQSPPSDAEAALIPSSSKSTGTRAVQLCRVDDRLIAVEPAPQNWFLPPSDAVAQSRATTGRIKVRPYRDELPFDNRILIAGCDPATSILARHLSAAGMQAILVHRNSSESLGLLKQRRVHIAGTHLRDESAITKRFLPNSVAVISFATWQEGLVVASGNPKHINSIEDLTRKRIQFVNREKGAGTRLLLDRALANLHIKSTRIQGYNSEAAGHLAAASQVYEGIVDCCIATDAAARVFGVDFVPLETARYDLVIHREHINLPVARALFDTLTRAGFRRELGASAGYDTAVTGARVL